MEAKFCNDTGFSYMDFLDELEPKAPLKHMYVERIRDIQIANDKSRLPESKYAGKDLEEVLVKIKTKVRL